MHKKCNCLNSAHTNQLFEKILPKIDTKKKIWGFNFWRPKFCPKLTPKKNSSQLQGRLKESDLISKKSKTLPSVSSGGVSGGSEGGLHSIGGWQCSGEEAVESISSEEWLGNRTPMSENQREGLSEGKPMSSSSAQQSDGPTGGLFVARFRETGAGRC